MILKVILLIYSYVNILYYIDVDKTSESELFWYFRHCIILYTSGIVILTENQLLILWVLKTTYENVKVVITEI